MNTRLPRQILGFATLLLLSTFRLIASDEGILPLNTFAMTSSGLDDSGPVSVCGAQTTTGISKLTIKAFGHNYSLTKAQLTELSGLRVNGIQCSFEMGYKETGGRTLYVLLTKGWTTGQTEGKLLIVTERGDIKIKKQLTQPAT
jgi:hypothetical protein